MKTVAYLRVSTAQQDAGSQRLALLEYARRQGFRIDDFIEATASARTNAKHRRLDQLMAVLEPGDRLVVSELSRLGRSLGEVVALLDAIAKASVVFVAVKENIRFESRQDLQTKVMTTLFARFAEVERDLISERTREGLAKARASGKRLGRPKGSLGVSRLDGREVVGTLMRVMSSPARRYGATLSGDHHLCSGRALRCKVTSEGISFSRSGSGQRGQVDRYVQNLGVQQ